MIIPANEVRVSAARLAATQPFEQFDAEDMIGSGTSRFVLDECAPGSRVVFERFDGHVPRDEPASFTAGGKVARIERVGRFCMPDPIVAVEELDTIGIVTAMWPNFLQSAVQRRARAAGTSLAHRSGAQSADR
jgi:hypothetical protein